MAYHTYSLNANLNASSLFRTSSWQKSLVCCSNQSLRATFEYRPTRRSSNSRQPFTLRACSLKLSNLKRSEETLWLHCLDIVGLNSIGKKWDAVSLSKLVVCALKNDNVGGKRSRYSTPNWVLSNRLMYIYVSWKGAIYNTLVTCLLCF